MFVGSTVAPVPDVKSSGRRNFEQKKSPEKGKEEKKFERERER